MHPVGGENTRLPVARVVLQVIVQEGFPEVGQRCFMGGRDTPDDITLVVEFPVLFIAEIRSFADDGRCTDDGPDIRQG